MNQLLDEMNGLLNEEDTRTKLGKIGRTKLYALTASGEIKSVKIGRRRFWPADAVTEFIDGLAHQGSAQ